MHKYIIINSDHNKALPSKKKKQIKNKKAKVKNILIKYRFKRLKQDPILKENTAQHLTQKRSKNFSKIVTRQLYKPYQVADQ